MFEIPVELHLILIVRVCRSIWRYKTTLARWTNINALQSRWFQYYHMIFGPAIHVDGQKQHLIWIRLGYPIKIGCNKPLRNYRQQPLGHVTCTKLRTELIQGLCQRF